MKQESGTLRKEFYPIPGVINPGSYVCATVYVPNHIDHVRAFRGAIATLEKWWNWQRTGDTQAAQTAQVWRDANTLLSIGECVMPTEYRMNSCGVIEFSADGGETWETLADFSNCFIWRAPDSDARNIIQSVANYRTIQFKRVAAQTADLSEWVLEDGSRRLRVDYLGNLKTKRTGTAFDGISVAEGFLGFNAEWNYSGTTLKLFDTASTGYGWLLFNNSLRLRAISPGASPSQGVDAISINGTDSFQFNGYLSANVTPNTGATLYLRNVAASSNRVVLQLDAQSGNSQPIMRNRDSVGNELSGVDKYGFFFMRLIAAPPGFSDAKTGSIAVDSVNQKVYIKMPASWQEWNQAGPQGDPPFTDVTAETLVPGEPATAEIVGDTLELGIPKGEPGEPGEPGTTFKYNSCGARPTVETILDFVLRADEYIVFPWDVYPYDQMNIISVDGWWSDQIIADWSYEPVQDFAGYDALGNNCITGETHTDDSDLAPTLPHMCGVMVYRKGDNNQGRIKITSGENTLSDMSYENTRVMFAPNTVLPLDGNSGGIQFTIQWIPGTVEICPSDFDFTDLSTPWRLKLSTEGATDDTGGQYSPNEGWITTEWTPYNEDALFILIENFELDLTGLNLVFEGSMRFNALGGGGQMSHWVRDASTGIWHFQSVWNTPGATVLTSQGFGPSTASSYNGTIDGIIFKIEWIRTHVAGEYCILENLAYTCQAE